MTSTLFAISAADAMDQEDDSHTAELVFSSAKLDQSLAVMLPYHILLQIFLEAVENDPYECELGGRLVRWDSNESLVNMPRICRAWEDAATTALYRSIALLSGSKARSFNGTLAQYPERGNKVKYLVVCVGDHLRESNDSPELAEDSQDLVHAITLCPNVRTLQVRPIHRTARVALLAALAPLELETLVCAPRIGVTMRDWSTGLYLPTDIELAKPTLKILELEFGAPHMPHALTTRLLRSPPPLFLPLVEMRLHCDLSDEALWALLSACQHLQVCDLYFEKMLRSDETAAALRASTNTIRNMRFICNPTETELDRFNPSTHKPIFDHLLPYQIHLHELAVSATEISTGVFRRLPPRLAKLEAHSFNHIGNFVFHQSLVDDMLNTTIHMGSLQTLIVHDTAASCTDDNIRSLEEACERRGISFLFMADENEPDFMID